MVQSCRIRLITLLICGIALSWLLASRATGVELTKKFAAELTESELVFDPTVFGEFAVARVLPNPHFDYEFALKHRNLPFEVRFATRHLPADTVIHPRPQSPSKQRNSINVHVPTDVEIYVITSIMNMVPKGDKGLVMADPEPFDTDAVKAEFNADWGATSRIVPDPTFAKYESGLVNVIYRDKNKVLGYFIFLYNGEMSGQMQSTLEKVFYAMRFRN